MSTYLFAWNPTHEEPASLSTQVRDLRKHGSVTFQWRSGVRRHLEVGSRVFMIRLGSEPKGIIGAGWTRTEPSGEPPCLDIEFEALSETPRIPSALLVRPPFSRFNWWIQGSGIKLPEDIASNLESLWLKRGILADRCVYTIRHSKELKRSLAAGKPTTYAEKRRWVEARKLLGEAKRAGRRLPVVFAPAEDTHELFGWATLDEVQIAGRRTKYTFSGHRRGANRTGSIPATARDQVARLGRDRLYGPCSPQGISCTALASLVEPRALGPRQRSPSPGNTRCSF